MTWEGELLIVVNPVGPLVRSGAHFTLCYSDSTALYQDGCVGVSWQPNSGSKHKPRMMVASK